MKSKADLVRGWLRKAESDLATAGLCVSAAEALDTACFHAHAVIAHDSLDTIQVTQ